VFDCVRSTNTRQVKRPRGISLVISLLIDGEDIARLEPPVLGERLRSGLFVVEVTLRDAVSLDPKFARFSGPTVRTILTNDPGLQAGKRRPTELSTGLYPGIEFSRIVVVIERSVRIH
jgi:hypothetical protein